MTFPVRPESVLHWSAVRPEGRGQQPGVSHLGLGVRSLPQGQAVHPLGFLLRLHVLFPAGTFPGSSHSEVRERVSVWFVLEWTWVLYVMSSTVLMFCWVFSAFLCVWMHPNLILLCRKMIVCLHWIQRKSLSIIEFELALVQFFFSFLLCGGKNYTKFVYTANELCYHHNTCPLHPSISSQTTSKL